MTAPARPKPPLDPSHLHAARTVPLEGDVITRAGVRALVAAAYRAGQYAARRRDPRALELVELAEARRHVTEEGLDAADYARAVRRLLRSVDKVLGS